LTSKLARFVAAYCHVLARGEAGLTPQKSEAETFDLCDTPLKTVHIAPCSGAEKKILLFGVLQNLVVMP
jgi:hypothetical protein